MALANPVSSVKANGLLSTNGRSLSPSFVGGRLKLENDSPADYFISTVRGSRNHEDFSTSNCSSMKWQGVNGIYPSNIIQNNGSSCCNDAKQFSPEKDDSYGRIVKELDEAKDHCHSRKLQHQSSPKSLSSASHENAVVDSSIRNWRRPLSADPNNPKPNLKRPEDLICPVCEEKFKTKRSFNSHILVHCQLVKSPVHSGKRPLPSDSSADAPLKRNTMEIIRKSEFANRNFMKNENSLVSTPLDLSCKKELDIQHNETSWTDMKPFVNLKDSNVEICHGDFSPRHRNDNLSSPPLLERLDNNNQPESALYVISDRSPFEDENDNLMNEAKEQENAFFDSVIENEAFLSEDSSNLQPLPPPLPLLKVSGETKKFRVSGDEGSSMVYNIRVHAEQIFASRILGVNEETGDKIELYKCFMCNISFPSLSRMQAHLLVHKQKFQCRKCDFLSDSRVEFSQHVQREHVMKEGPREKVYIANRSLDDSFVNAENSVTVAALLSALHGNVRDDVDIQRDQKEGLEDLRPQCIESLPASPLPSDSQLSLCEGSSNREVFKMYSCRFCGKKFDRAFSCNRHERVHTGYKPCFCRICGRGFSEPRNLRHHVIRFHSDGSLRHLIKRDRRKKRDDENSNSSDSSVKESFIENASEDSPSSSSSILGSLLSLSHPKVSCNESINNPLLNPSSDSKTALSSYTDNLTKIFAATMENSHFKMMESNSPSESMTEHENGVSESPNSPNLDPVMNSDGKSADDSVRTDPDESLEPLEPGEIRLGSRYKVIDCGGKGRRLVIEDGYREEVCNQSYFGDSTGDRSLQFSSYAPRLNIVHEPVNREKALVPLTDDFGRLFYQCSYCSKLFGSTSDLNRHLDFHEDLRPYDCQYCDYSARTNSQLKVHKMRHEGIKQFNCDVCNYNGVTQSDLNRHKKTQSHVARSRNVCAVCGLGFYSGSQKQVHVSNCHPEMEGASSLLQMSMGLPPPSGNQPQNVGAASEGVATSMSSPLPSASPDLSSPFKVVRSHE